MGGSNGSASKVAALGGLFRELQLRRRVPVPCIAGGAAYVAADSRDMRRRAVLPHRQGKLRYDAPRRPERGGDWTRSGSDGRGKLDDRRLHRRARGRPTDRGAWCDLWRRRGWTDGCLRTADRDSPWGEEGGD